MELKLAIKTSPHKLPGTQHVSIHNVTLPCGLKLAKKVNKNEAHNIDIDDHDGHVDDNHDLFVLCYDD